MKSSSQTRENNSEPNIFNGERASCIPQCYVGYIPFTVHKKNKNICPYTIVVVKPKNHWRLRRVSIRV